MASIEPYRRPIPRLSTEQMIEVDRLMIEEYQIELIQMMENAGRCLAILARERFLENNPVGKQVVILAGTGGNGGGILVCARRLHNWGAVVQVFLTHGDDKMTSVPRHQLEILRRMGLEIHLGDALEKAPESDLILDGIIGYSIKGNPHGLPKRMIEWANEQPAPILSLDTPSGLDLTSGKAHNPTVKATATLTLALPKQGLFESGALPNRGELYLGDISVPTELYAEPSLGMAVSKDLFAQSDVVEIKPELDGDKVQALGNLLTQTGKAHHEAFSATDGFDPEWALWYAAYLDQPLAELLQRKLTRSRIIYELIRMDSFLDPGDKPWGVAYAEELIRRYG